jgi:hypothetical protein
MSDHRYPPAALTTDYLRSGAGFLLTGGPLLLAKPSTPMVYILGGLAILFVLFGLRTALRQMTRIEMTDTRLSATGPLGSTIHWESLEGVKLRYFSTRRDRSEGWMQLKLTSGAGSIRLDSEISDFAAIAARAAHEAEHRGLPLSEATRANLSTLGLRYAAPLQEAPRPQ